MMLKLVFRISQDFGMRFWVVEDPSGAQSKLGKLVITLLRSFGNNFGNIPLYNRNQPHVC